MTINDIVALVCSEIPGYTSPDELTWLAQRARETPTHRKVVEVGVWLGRSLAALTLARPTGTVIGVDHFEGNPELERLIDSSGALKARCEDNLRRVGASPELWDIPSHVACLSIDRDVGLLFLDANHTYEGVRSDLLWWIPKLAPGGTLVVHDYHLPQDNPDGGFPGVAQAVDELCLGFDVLDDLPGNGEWCSWVGVRQ